jgi:hypothetical protein
VPLGANAITPPAGLSIAYESRSRCGDVDGVQQASGTNVFEVIPLEPLLGWKLRSPIL